MKLFQKLLVAPAALGLMAPIAANAGEFNPASQFSSTTTLEGAATFSYGSVQDSAAGEELTSMYSYILDLNSSFTGEDLLHASIETGDCENQSISVLDSCTEGDSGLNLAYLWYSFPLGDDLTVSVGPKAEQSFSLVGTSGTYSSPAVMGREGINGSLNETAGAGVGIAYTGDNGFNASLELVSPDATDSNLGIMSDGTEVWTAQFGYDADGYGGAITYSDVEDTYSAIGVGVYFTPADNLPSITFDYDQRDPDTGDEVDNWLIGVEGEAGVGNYGIAYGTWDGDDNTGFEAWYAYPVNDSVSVTPMVWVQEDDSDNETTGVAVEVGFSF